MDAYGQYFPMLVNAKSVISQWSFAGALGFNQLAQSAYYTNSPLWFILLFVPNNAMIAAVDMIVGLRFGFAGLTFCLWLREKHKTDSLTIVFFSTAYSLSAYTLSFINQFMWMDVVVLLPVVALGLEKLFRFKKPYLYIFSLALTLYTNFYIGFIVCVFSVTYVLYMCFRRKISWKKRANLFLHFILSSLLSGGMVSIVLIPTYLALKRTIASNLTFNGGLEFYHTPIEILAKLLPFSKISLAFEAPNLYCGLVIVLLCLLYIFKRNNTLRSRVVFITLAVFAYLSLNFNIFDFIWHGFHFPNQLPARHSFIAIFAMISLAYSVFIDINKKSIAYILAIILLIEISANSIYTISTQTWKGNAVKYTMHDSDMEYITEKYKDDGNNFHRMELLTPSYNAGLRYGYNGIGYYSSTMSANAYNFFENIGMEIYAKRVSSKYVSSNILNSIFGIKYLVDIDGTYDNSLFIKEIELLDKATVYENPYSLPLAFVVDQSVLDVDMSNEYALDLQDEILKHMLGDESSKNYTNESDFADAIYKLRENSLQITSFSETDITGTVTNNKDGILYTSIPNDGGWSIFVDGKETEVLTIFDYLCGIRLSEGKHTVRLVYKTPGIKLGSIISFISIGIFLIYNNKLNKLQKK